MDVARGAGRYTMTQRYTYKDAVRAMERLADDLGKPLGHYRTVAPGEVSSLGADRQTTTIPGGWVLDYNPIYGGCVIEERGDEPGATWSTHPRGGTRRSPREFCEAVSFARTAMKLARQQV